jgi:hypothetical protein
VHDERRHSRLRSFALGSIVGASAVLAALGRRPARHRPRGPVGLAAFEDAPCYRELVEREEQASSATRRAK